MSKLKDEKRELKKVLKIIKEKLKDKDKKLTPKEKRLLIRSGIKNLIRILLVSAGIALTAIGISEVKQLDSGEKSKDDNKKIESTTGKEISEDETKDIENETGYKIVEDNTETRGKFVNVLKVDVQPETLPEPEFDTLVQDIVNEYNEIYNETLNNEDVGFYENRTQVLSIDDNGNYYIDTENLNNIDKKIYNNKENKIENTYMVIDRRNNTVISSLGKVNNEYVNIEAKNLETFNGTEYRESEKNIDLTKLKDKEELSKTYTALKKEVEKADKSK